MWKWENMAKTVLTSIESMMPSEKWDQVTIYPKIDDIIICTQ